MNTDKKAVVVSGGTLQEAFVLEVLKSLGETDCIIGADRGVLFLYEHKIEPMYIVGDFDSLPSKVLEYYRKEAKIPIREYNPMKDFTDTEIAANLAMQLGYKNVWILGGTGTRIDHMLANIQVLAGLYERGVKGVLLDAYNRITLIDGETHLKKEDMYGAYFSVFPLEEDVLGLDIKGAKYPLSNHTLTSRNSLCVSNEIAEEAEKAVIDFPYGLVILIEAKDA